MSTQLSTQVPLEGTHTAAPEALAQAIRDLEWQCRESPGSADLHVRLALAHAMNFDAVRAAESLEAALHLDPRHFPARLQYAGMQVRLGHWDRAAEQASRALELAANAQEMAAARRVAEQARRLPPERSAPGAGRSPWFPLLVLAALFLAVFLLRA